MKDVPACPHGPPTEQTGTEKRKREMLVQPLTTQIRQVQTLGFEEGITILLVYLASTEAVCKYGSVVVCVWCGTHA